MATSQDTSTDKNPLMSQLGLDRLVEEAQELGRAAANRGVSTLSDRIDSLTDNLAGAASGGGSLMKATASKASPKAKLKAGAEIAKDRASAVGQGTTDGVKGGLGALKDKVGGLLGGGKSKKNGDKKLKVTNIVESVDVPVDRSTAYQLWTQFEDFPTFMKKVENVKQKNDATLEWKAQIFWSHRSWTAKIIEQVPDDRIVWRSEGEKGHVNGAVTFHELAPNLTRVLVTLEYHPQGLFEHTGNIWRAQGRRARLELKHYRRHVSTQTLLKQEDVDGWTGEIHKGKVTRKSGRQSGEKSASSGSGRSRSDSSRPAKKTSSSKQSSSSKRSSSRSSGGTSSTSGSSAAKKAGGSSRKSASSQSSTAKKSTAKKAPAKRAPAKKSAAKKSTAKKSTAKKSSPARKTARKRTTAKR